MEKLNRYRTDEPCCKKRLQQICEAAVEVEVWRVLAGHRHTLCGGGPQVLSHFDEVVFDQFAADIAALHGLFGQAPSPIRSSQKSAISFQISRAV